MTQDSSTTPEIPSAPHPYVCPRCDRRTGMVDIATGISECGLCGTAWKGPRLLLFDPKDLQTSEGIDEVIRQVDAKLNLVRDEEHHAEGDVS